jgi:hypothetical protein
VITFGVSVCRASAMTEQDLALGLSRMVRVFSRLATLEGTGATCVEVGMIADRFWAKVEIGEADQCWEWKTKFRSRGYGRFEFLGAVRAASRVAWALNARVFPPPHLLVCHTCDNRLCCNPSHLFLGTKSDNAWDSVRKGRHPLAARTECKAGHPLVEGNIAMRRNSRGRPWRSCIECARAKARSRVRRKEPL